MSVSECVSVSVCVSVLQSVSMSTFASVNNSFLSIFRGFHRYRDCKTNRSLGYTVWSSREARLDREQRPVIASICVRMSEVVCMCLEVSVSI